MVEQQAVTSDTLTGSTAYAIAEIMQACQVHAKGKYYLADLGDGTLRPREFVFRGLTHADRSHWFDTDGDVRDAYVWTSGVIEHAYPMRELLTARLNIDTQDVDHALLYISGIDSMWGS